MLGLHMLMAPIAYGIPQAFLSVISRGVFGHMMISLPFQGSKYDV